MTAVGIIIVQNHGVNAQLNQPWLFYPQAPDKQRLQQPTKQKYAGSGKSVEKSFDPMLGGHHFHAGFDASSMPCVLGKLIKIAQMPAGAINHKTQDLFEKLKDLNTLAALADRTEKSVHQWKDVDAIQVGDKQCQSGFAGQTIAGLLYTSDFLFSFLVISAIFIHEVLLLVGLAAIVMIFIYFNNDYGMLPAKGGLFYFINRST